ncbi:MAG: 2-oxoglutarate ferredoxin oxidoreductase subunit alpha, partial [Thermoleophilaceae bacterium]|nr:2-oxoglutarate ferredoxin oxidoreductase subunit alpha [Thermoleophilaceae bacterium]
AGAEFARESLPDVCNLQPPNQHERERILLSGNQAIVAAALHSGLSYFAGYPITPASDILESLSARLPRYGGVVIQTEDEIAALASVLGASFTGAKAMTATSGPGLSLMSELIALSGAAELPVVIVDAQRAGPSTGMPTKTEQSDLNQALYGSHGEAPRAVIAPTTVEDCFQSTIDAFNAAETYQVPVIMLSDQSLSHRLETVYRPQLDEFEVQDRKGVDAATGSNGYHRYELTADGVSPISTPGTPGAYVSTGIEHDEYGHPAYTTDVHEAMQAKRFDKLRPLAANGRVTTSGPDQAMVGLLGWGSTEGAAIEAAQILTEQGITAATFYPRFIVPLPVERLKAWAAGMGTIIVPEVNFTGQFARVVRADCELPLISYTQITGLPFTAQQIADFVIEKVGATAGAAA